VLNNPFTYIDPTGHQVGALELLIYGVTLIAAAILTHATMEYYIQHPASPSTFEILDQVAQYKQGRDPIIDAENERQLVIQQTQKGELPPGFCSYPSAKGFCIALGLVMLISTGIAGAAGHEEGAEPDLPENLSISTSTSTSTSTSVSTSTSTSASASTAPYPPVINISPSMNCSNTFCQPVFMNGSSTSTLIIPSSSTPKLTSPKETQLLHIR
jgi:hypothetical protein